MGRLLRLCVLSAAIAALVAAAGLPTTAPAQGKQTEPKTAQPKEELGVTQVYMAKAGWRFRIKNAEGQSVAVATIGYDKKQDCLNVVEMVKATLTKTKIVEIKEE